MIFKQDNLAFKGGLGRQEGKRMELVRTTRAEIVAKATTAKTFFGKEEVEK